jgi:hypothetical protein
MVHHFRAGGSHKRRKSEKVRGDDDELEERDGVQA